MKYDKVELAKKIREAENLSNDDKSALLQLLNEKKTYGLVWEDSTEDAWEELKMQMPVLREVEDRRIVNDTDDEKHPNHVLIEGENLDALVALTYTHAGLIDVMYFDPPYNTGNKDFVYNDSFVESEDSYRHSKWLSFMEKRLRMAKTLLSDKGVIFISIDDNEQANLKLLCDEVFGFENFVGNVIWEKTDSPRMDVSGFTVRHDYILVYQKPNFSLKRIQPDEIPDHYNKVDNNGRRYYLKPLRLMGGHKSESLYYGIEAPDGTIVYPKETNGDNGCWRWSKTKYEEEIERIEWVRGKKGWSANFRIYADNLTPTPANTIWPFEKVGSTRTAKMELSNIVQQFIFSYPKPTSLITFIEKIASDSDSIILDFFAGSGTTLHATMQLNAEDGGHRQCILVTNNENRICEEVTYERNKRVIQGYTTPKGEQVAGLTNNNLRYYKVGFTPREKTEENMLRLAIKSIPMLCIKNDIYAEQPQLGRLENKNKGYRYYKEGDRQMLVILDADMIGSIVRELERMDVAAPIPTYVYAAGHYPYTEDFATVSGKVDLYPIPYSIYGACEKVMPPMDDKELEQPEGVVLTAEEENLSINDYNMTEEA